MERSPLRIGDVVEIKSVDDVSPRVQVSAVDYPGGTFTGTYADDTCEVFDIVAIERLVRLRPGTTFPTVSSISKIMRQDPYLACEMDTGWVRAQRSAGRVSVFASTVQGLDRLR